MRINYTLSELTSIYERLVIKAESLYNRNRLDDCVKSIQAAAELQYNLNYIYTDERLLTLLRNISKDIFTSETEPLNDNVVFFYDSFCLDNRGLTQHYLDALVDAGKYKIVYLLENPNYNHGYDIITYLKSNNAVIEILPEDSIINKSRYVYQLIKKYRPISVFFHLTPYTSIPFLAFYPFPQIIKYQVNLTDHAFWLGSTDFFDYLYEFRQYGIEVSVNKRGYDINQLILNPYYPWQSGLPFQGFPVKTDGKVILFSGGAMYKIDGEDGMYFKLVKSLLDRYPGVIMFYAGGGNDSHLQHFIKENSYYDRLILLGNRKDIDAVFKECDIYLSTYPFGGGLMSQFAAINAKPILLYKSRDIEKLICTKKYSPYALQTIEDFIAEAELLIKNKEYREERGLFFKDMLLGKEDFRAKFQQTFMNTSYCADYIITHNIDYKAFADDYVERINKNSFGFIEKLFIKNKIFTCKIFVNSCFQLPRFLVARIKRKVNRNKLILS